MAKSDLDGLATSCKGIKISPSLADVLADIGFYSDLDINANQWLQQLNISWRSWKRSVTVENHIENFYLSRPDVFKVALIFVSKCEDYKDCKPKTLPYFLIEVLYKFSTKYQVNADEFLKLPAFYTAIFQRNQQFLNLMAKTYQIGAIKELIIPIVRDMIKNDDFRRAIQIVIALEIFGDIPVDYLLFPFVLQDKTNSVDEYLNACPGQAKPFLLFLDKLLDKKFDTTQFAKTFAEENNIYEVKYDKLHYKPLGKLVARLCNKYNIPIETCKNLCKNRTTGGLRYLMYQKYAEKNVSSSVWDDLVKDSLRQNAESAPEFIDMLLNFDKKEALKWARYLNLPDSELPSALQGSQDQKDTPEENWSSDIKTEMFYKSSLTRNQIIIIDTGDKFNTMLRSDIVHLPVLSLDCEWKPSFGTAQSQVAIIQVATPDIVYLIDTILLNRQEYITLWHIFFKMILDNAEIIKLGFGLEQDLQIMKLSIVGLSNLMVRGEGFLDLCILWKTLLEHKLSLPTSSDGMSLTSVVQSCFGLPLEKSEQCSNWELRPLRETQIEYAALDAFILMEIYAFLADKCREQRIPFEEICNDIMTSSKKKVVKKQKIADKLEQSLFIPKAVSSVKFLLEPTLSHLVSFLRYCGINTVIHPNTMMWHDVINSAISEDRIILLSKLKMTPTNHFPQKSILDIGKGSVSEQLHKVIKTFMINVTPSDILSICLYCNSRELKKLTPNEVIDICQVYESSCSSSSYKYLPDQSTEQDDYEDFLSESESEEIPCHMPVMAYKERPKTSKGATIDIDFPQQLRDHQHPAILCESCGKLYSEYDSLIQQVKDTVLHVIQLKL